MIRGYDQWKTASPADDFNDDVCYCCGLNLESEHVTADEDTVFDGFCSTKCKEQIDNKKGFLPVYRPIAELFSDLFEDFDIDRLKKAIYKGTDCGAWVAINDSATLQVGSIVEGSDVEITADPLVWPFTKEEFWNTVQWVNDEAVAAWNECHCTICGCELECDEVCSDCEVNKEGV